MPQQKRCAFSVLFIFFPIGRKNSNNLHVNDLADYNRTAGKYFADCQQSEFKV